MAAFTFSSPALSLQSLPALALATRLTTPARSRHSRPRACAEPPALEERQAAIMRASGYSWDAERKRWFRGDPTRRVRAEARSGGRTVRFVDAAGEPVTGEVSPALAAASQRFAATVQEARRTALGDRDEATDLQVKDALASPVAPLAWLCTHGALLLAAAALFDPQWPALDVPTAQAAGLGLACAPALCALRRAQAAAQPGVEHLDGALERALADAALGSHALPAPWAWRGASARWRALAGAAELGAGATVAVYTHAGLQAALADASGAPWLAAAAVALPPVARAALAARPPYDGAPAEAAAARRAARTAEAYFLQTAGGEAGDARARAARAAAAAAAFRALARGWERGFGGAAAAGWRLPLCAGGGAVLGGGLWLAAGGAMAAPLAAHAAVVADAYLLRCDGAARETVDVSLAEVEAEASL